MTVNSLLSHSGYNKLGSFRPIACAEDYYALAYKANDVLLHLTGHFYRDNDFESDKKVRKTAYLKALACQIEYFYETGQSTTAGLNSLPQLMDVGRTKVSMMAHVNEEGKTVPKSIVCPDIALYLDGTGLLDGSDV